MTKAELIERIARNRDLPPDITKKCIAEIVDIAFAELAGYFVRARVTRSSIPRFAFPNFGTFTKKKRPARRGVNPRTLEPMEIDASSTLDFKPAAALKKAMNQEKDGSGKRKPKRKSKSKSKSKSKAGADAGASGRRRLRSREEVELETLDDGTLPDAPLRRAGRSRKSMGRTG
jgi:DNA-binding protein HU-beta